MFELNLLPPELRTKKKAQMPEIKPVPILIGVAGVLIFMHFALAVLAMNNAHTLRNLGKKWEEMRPQKEITDRIARETNELERKVAAVRAIAKPKVSWTRLLSGLNDAMTPTVWLSDFKLLFGGKGYRSGKAGDVPTKLILTGYALGRSDVATATVAKFINSLKRSKDFFGYFDTIELLTMKSGSVAGEEVMVFNLTCAFKQPEEPAKPVKKKRR